MDENEAMKGTEVTTELECLDIPEIRIVFKGDFENVNITVNHFGKEDEE